MLLIDACLYNSADVALVEFIMQWVVVLMKKMIKFNFNQIVDYRIAFFLLDININKIPPTVVSWEIYYEIYGNKRERINSKN